MRARPLVAIDLVPIRAGSGGAGGGIWSYASALVAELDLIAPPDVDIVCLARPEQPLPPLERVAREAVAMDARSPVARLDWVHRRLPAWCARRGVGLLHKLASEAPWRPGRCRLVTTVQDFMAEFYREVRPSPDSGASPRARLERAYFETATRHSHATSAAIITTTRAVAEEARMRHPRAAGRIHTIPLGVDHGSLAPLAGRPAGAAPGPGAGPRLLCVGAFLPHKGQHLAVDAFERFVALAGAGGAPHAAGATLTLRGHAADPAYHARVRAAVEASPLAARIRMPGYEVDATPAARYGEADLVLQLSAYEGFGLPPLEAQAAGIPVIASDIPAAREVLGDGAIFVPRDDTRRIAQAIARVTAEPALRAELVARGLANAARYSWSRTARETLELYRLVLGGDAGGARRASAR